jgi:O-antigen ligase
MVTIGIDSHKSSLYLVGLVVLSVVLALVRQGSRSHVIALLVAGAAVTLVGAVGQLTPPAPAQRAALAALVEDPERHQDCEQRRGITYCAYPAYVSWIDR